MCPVHIQHTARVPFSVKYWEIIADNLKKAGWSYGYISPLDCEGRTIWIVDAHCDDGKRYVVHAEQKTDGVSRIGNGEAGVRPRPI